MAAPNYTTDLAVISLCDALGTWVEPGTWIAGQAPVLESDYYIQGTNCISHPFNATGLGGSIFNNASGITVPGSGAVMFWCYHGAPNAIDTEANGGYRIIIGSAQTAFNAWKAFGNDTYAYGGWVCVPVDPTVTVDYTVGSPTSTLQWFGVAVNSINAVSKGNPLAVDAVRYGRCEARMNGGDLANGYATFDGFAATNDTNSNRWGLIQAISGGFQMQGLVVLGYSSAVDFRDSNTSVVIANTKKVSANFNAFEVRQATSRVDWTNITFLALGTVSRGNFITTDNADINITGCTFTDMGTFGFQSNSTILTTTFRRCSLVTQSSAIFDGCTFDSTNDSTKAILSNNPANIQNCTFISSGTKHAIEINTAGTYTFHNNSFTGYTTSNGSTGNEVIYNNSGGAVTLNVTGSGTGTISYRNGAGATTTVASSASLVINIVDSEGAAITQNCEVTVVKNSDTTILFEEDNITDGTTTYSYSSGGGTVTYVNVLNITGYQPKTVNGVTLPSSGSTTLTVQLDTDPFYSNPT